MTSVLIEALTIYFRCNYRIFSTLGSIIVLNRI